MNQCAYCQGWFGVAARWIVSWVCDVCRAAGHGVTSGPVEP